MRRCDNWERDRITGLWLPERGSAPLKQHHSTGDWDFELASWSLNASDYVSAPASLDLTKSGLPMTWFAVLCNQADTEVIEQGRVATYLKYFDYTFSIPVLIFRAQAALGSASLLTSYVIEFQSSGVKWSWIDAGGTSNVVGGLGAALATSTWHHVRVTWWNGKNALNQDATVCRFETESGGTWTQQGTDLYDTNERNKGSSVNRAGIGAKVAGTRHVRFDDTEVWCTGA